MIKADLWLHRKIVEWLNDRWPEPRRCVVCGADNWSLGYFVQEAIQLLDEELRADVADDADDTHPGVAAFFTVTCLSCAHIHFFDAELAGIVSRADLRERAAHEATRLAADVGTR